MWRPSPRPAVDRIRDATDAMGEDWLRLLVAGAVTMVAVATAVEFALDPFHVSDDSALFQHAGWYIARGSVLYEDVWDLKPPLVYAVKHTPGGTLQKEHCGQWPFDEPPREWLADRLLPIGAVARP